MNDFLTTTIPCPPWCQLPAGHRFESEDHNGILYRFHVRDIARVDIGGKQGPAVAQVSSEEPVADIAGPPLNPGPVVVNLFGVEEGATLTGPEARRIAAALLNAADEWDRITGATP